MRIIEVEWNDSSGLGGDTWQDKDEAIRKASEEGSTSCWSVGYVLCEDENQITLTLSHNGEHGMVMDPTVIPRCAVTKITPLTVSK